MADGDLVIRVSSRSMPKPDGKGVSTGYIFNMFRVQDGKLAEHWDASSGTMMMPPHKGDVPQLPPGPPKG
jgi:predicted SnoaL-like aldol condensation-catalyzing enzyme